MVTHNGAKLTQELKAVAFSNHVDFIGIADPKVFDDIPVNERPRGLLEDARAVVVYSVKYRDADCLLDKNWYDQTDALLERIDKKLKEFLNGKGYKAHSFLKASAPHNLYGELQRQAVGEGTPPHPGRWHEVFHKMRDAAVAAGLGCLNKNMMIIIPQYGPYHYLSMIITDAPLKPDTPFDKDLCEGCNICIEACPTSALSGGVLPDFDKCKPMDCHFTCLRVCNEKFQKQQPSKSSRSKSRQ